MHTGSTGQAVHCEEEGGLEFLEKRAGGGGPGMAQRTEEGGGPGIPGEERGEGPGIPGEEREEGGLVFQGKRGDIKWRNLVAGSIWNRCTWFRMMEKEKYFCQIRTGSKSVSKI